METKSYARIQEGSVAEVFATDADMVQLFNPALVWVEVTDMPNVSEGWKYDGSSFTAPVPIAAPLTPSIAELQAQLRALTAKMAAIVA